MGSEEYIEDAYKITKYENGTIIRKLINAQNNDFIELQATIEEQILAENQYQTALLEMQMLGGM